MRALGTDLPGLSPKKIDRRPYRPGQHGAARRRRPTEYAIRLIEKQKLRANYGLTESQLRRLVQEALASHAPSGSKLVELIERRLDNVVFRAGLARTIPAARQMVAHGHVQVNGRRVTIASFRTSLRDVIALRSKPGETARRPDPEVLLPPWLVREEDGSAVRVAGLPDESAVPFPFEPRRVVEFYSPRL